MNKKYLYSLCAASMLLMTSCEKDNLFGNAWGEKEQTVTLSVSLPEMSTTTRAYGEGKTATNLQYAMFEVGAEGALNYLAERTVTDKTLENGSATIELKLVSGTNYKLIFWADAYAADAADRPYTVDLENGLVTIDYTKTLSNTESNDAFFGNCDITFNNTFDIPEIVELVRPFAQLNIATNDAEEAKLSGFEVVKSEVVIENLNDQLNLFTGAASSTADGGSLVVATFAKNDLPEGVFTIDNNAYSYLAMNYVLMGVEHAADHKVTITCFDGDDVEKAKTFTFVPFGRNWRTNIFGSMFTQDNEITVTISPNFADQVNSDDKYNGENGQFPDPDAKN